MIALRLSLALPILAGAIVSWPASATPPDIIDVRDDVFGITDDSILVLRSTKDNLGIYLAEHRDTFLVAIDRNTGQETLWPVYSAHLNFEPTDTDLPVRGELPHGSVNPFEILRERNGVPFAAWAWRSGGSITVSGDNISVTYGDGAAFQLKMSALQHQMTSSLDRLANRIADYKRLAPVRTKDLLAGQAYEVASCEFLEPVFYAGSQGAAPARLLRMTCEQDEGQIASLLLSIR